MSDVLRRLVLGLAAIGAVAALVLAVSESETGPDTRFTDSAVQQLIPKRGDHVLRQAEVGIDLDTGYTGVLIVDGVEIPEDQYRRVDPLNQVFFMPGAGKEFEQFSPGELCVESLFWKIGSARATGRSVRWCFNVS